MKRIFVTAICVVMVLALLSGCMSQQESSDNSEIQYSNENSQVKIYDEAPPWDALLNLEIMNAKFRFQRIATTPCIVYSDTPISDMSKGTLYADRYDILTTMFNAMDNKDANVSTSECEFSHYFYLFDNQFEDAPWHYRFAFCDCGAVMITNNNEFLCSIKISNEELQSILNVLN